MTTIKKVLLAMLLVSITSFTIFANGTTEKESASTPTMNANGEVNEDSLPVIRVAVMPMFNGSTVNYIVKNKLDIKNGFKIEQIMFTSGAPMNEALSTDSYDVAATGGAYIYGIGVYNAKVIGVYADESSGNQIWVRKDDPLTTVKGSNPDYPNLIGSPETLKGKTILQTTGTTMQYVAVTYTKTIGLPLEDVKMVNMDMPTAYQAFVSGRGDLAALGAPWCYKPELADIATQVCDLPDFDAGVLAYLMMPSKKYKDPEKKALAVKLLTVMLEVNDIFQADHQEMIDAVYGWYQDSGNNTSKADVTTQCKYVKYPPTDVLKNMEFGKTEKEYAMFLIDNNKLQPSNLTNIEKNIDDESFQTALKAAIEYKNKN